MVLVFMSASLSDDKISCSAYFFLSISEEYASRCSYFSFLMRFWSGSMRDYFGFASFSCVGFSIILTSAACSPDSYLLSGF